MTKILKRLFRTIQILLIVLLMAAVGHWYFGYGYLLTGVRHTYLKGKTGPGITDSHIFYNRTIEAKFPRPWNKSLTFKKHQLSKSTIKEIEQFKPASFLVVQNGEICFEKYWEDIDINTKTNSFSIAKSLVGLLIGIAIDEGKIRSFDQKVSDFLPEFKTPEKENITIRHLLAMSSGLKWLESQKNPYSDNARAYYGNNLKQHVLGLEKEKEPGLTFEYKSGNSQLLALVIEAATEKSVSTYLEEKIWLKINAESDALWNLDQENGLEKAFCCFYSTTRDFAKIGQMMLQNGNFNGQQIISPHLAKEMTSPQTTLKTVSGKTNECYGLHWWTGIYKNENFFYARGIKGQYIIVYPATNQVIVRTGSKRGEIGTDEHPIDLWIYLKAAEELMAI